MVLEIRLGEMLDLGDFRILVNFSDFKCFANFVGNHIFTKNVFCDLSRVLWCDEFAERDGRTDFPEAGPGAATRGRAGGRNLSRFRRGACAPPRAPTIRF